MEACTRRLRRVATAVAVVAAALSSIAVVWAAWRALAYDGDGLCTMSYSKPRYRRLALQPHPHYAVYRYTDGFAKYTRSHLTTSLHLILFLPGNVGSYKQFRSIASRVVRKLPTKAMTDAIEFYTFDFGEEQSALSATALESQGKFVTTQIQLLVQARLKALFLDKAEASIILVGHSMGGLVATSLFCDRDFPSDMVAALYMLGSPIRGPIISTELDLDNFYLRIRETWRRKTPTHPSKEDVDIKPLTVSISGGLGDLQVESGLSDLHGVAVGDFVISVVASNIPMVDVPVQHQVLVWCSELVEVLSDSIIAMVDLDAVDSSHRNLRRRARSASELNRFVYGWRDTLRSFVNSDYVYATSSEARSGDVVSISTRFPIESDSVTVELPKKWRSQSALLFLDAPQAVEVCSSLDSCQRVPPSSIMPLLASSPPTTNATIGPRHVVSLNRPLLQEASFVRLFAGRNASSQSRVWGMFSSTGIPVHESWGTFNSSGHPLVAVSVRDNLAVDVFCHISIRRLSCAAEPSSPPLVVASPDNHGIYQGSQFVGEGETMFRFFRSSAQASKINAMFVMDPQCLYEVSIEPELMPSFLASLFYDLYVTPQLVVALLLALLSVQMLVHAHRVSQAHSSAVSSVVAPRLSVLMLSNAPEAVLLCGFVSLTLPHVLELSIPHSILGSSSAVPLPTSKSVWSLFAASMLGVGLICVLLEAAATRLSRFESENLLGNRSLSAVWTWSFIMLAPLFLRLYIYSVVAVVCCLLHFLRLYRLGMVPSTAVQANTSYEPLPLQALPLRPLLVSWLVLYACLLTSCIPRWSAYSPPSPFSGSVYDAAKYLLFIASNWLFFAGAEIASNVRRQRYVAWMLLILGTTVLLWSPRSIAVFGGVTTAIWLQAVLLRLIEGPVSITAASKTD